MILKYNGFSDRAPCTKLHKVEQKDRTKTLAEFPDYVLNDYDYIHRIFVSNLLFLRTRCINHVEKKINRKIVTDSCFSE